MGIRQNQGPPIKERQYGAKVKSGFIQRKRHRLPEENIGQSSFYMTKVWRDKIGHV